MKDIIYKTSDGSLEYRLSYIVKNNFRLTHLGKSWPLHTQCLLYCNGLLQHFETIIKHRNEKSNQEFAYKLVSEKCLKSIKGKWLRSQVRIKLNEELMSITKT